MLRAKGIDTDIDALIKEEFGDNFYATMSQKKQELNSLDQGLSNAEKNLREVFGDSIYDIDSIIHGIKTTSFSSDVTGENILMSLYGDYDNELLNAKMLDALKDYNQAYSSYFNTFIDDAQYISKIGQHIRGDEMLYTLGIDTGNGQLKEYILNSDQWGQLTSDRSLFSLQRNSNGNISLALNRSMDYSTNTNTSEFGLSAENLMRRIEEITGSSLGGKGSVFYGGAGTTEIRQQIWEALKQSDIASQSSIAKFQKTGNADDLVFIKDSRKYEILNDGTLWAGAYDQSLSAQDRATVIQGIINSQYDVSKGLGFTLDNTFSGARGDNIMMGLNDQQLYSTQQKFFGSGGSQYGFGVISFTAINNAMSFYSNQSNIDKSSRDAADNLVNSDKVQKILDKASELLTYKEAAYMLADIGIISYDEADEIGEEVDRRIDEGDYDEESESEEEF